MGLRTTAFDRATALEWDISELARRSGLSVETLYKLRAGTRQPGQKAIEGLMRAFPALSYRDLFVPADSTTVQQIDTVLQEPAAA
jgi:transcriptional regulator with XRE-family HTH domain